jgi:EmrB/QacA subfamily drug resistance transporter
MTDTKTPPGTVEEQRPPVAPAGGGAGAATSELDPRRWMALVCVLTAAFMVLLDISIVNVAIPSIQSNLHASFGEVQLVLAGYALAYAVLLITGGRLGDIFGRKRMFMLGMAGFVVASALCGLAQNPTMLVSSRVLQGLMAALMYPQVLSVIQVLFPPQERGKAFGIFGAIIGLATVTGPLAGGLIIRDDITGSSWRWIFLVNLPIGIASLVAAARVLPESRSPQATHLDLTGVAIVTTGLGLLVFPLVEGRDLGWPAWSFVLLAISPIALALFVTYERRIQSGGSPLVLLSLFGNRSFRVGWLMSGLFFAGIPSFFFVFSLMLQIGLGFSALHAGLTTIPFSVASAIASTMSVRLAPKLGRNILALGTGLLIIGMLGLVLAIATQGESINSWELFPPLFVSGLGLGTVIAPLLNIILGGVTGREAGSASGLITTIQQVGGAIGVAVIGVIFFGLLGSRAGGIADDLNPQLQSQVAAAVQSQGTPPSQAQAIAAQVGSFFHQCFVDRSNAKDPTELPPSCTPPPGSPVNGQVQAVIQDTGKLALARDFTGAVDRTILVNAGIWALVFVMVLLLPPRRREEASGPPQGAAAAH